MKPDFSKYADGLVPAIIQDAVSSKVLMLGFMNAEALSKTTAEGKVTFLVAVNNGSGRKEKQATIF